MKKENINIIKYTNNSGWNIETYALNDIPAIAWSEYKKKCSDMSYIGSLKSSVYCYIYKGAPIYEQDLISAIENRDLSTLNGEIYIVSGDLDDMARPINDLSEEDLNNIKKEFSK